MNHFKSLENHRVRLDLLQPSYLADLMPVATELGLVKYSPSEIHSEDHLRRYIEVAINGFNNGNTIPLAIYDKLAGEYAGSTRFGLIDHDNRVLHIGWTWIGYRFQGSGLNENMKYLMLEYAFENMEFHKVEFRIDERNMRSRKAVEKLGATLEGILRENVVLSDGFRRNSCCYGILNTEWPGIKVSLLQKITR